jgi:hypothetical protein
MDLRFTYTYNSQGVAGPWTLTFTDVPLFMNGPEDPSPAEWLPSLSMADGSERRLFAGVVGGYWVTTSFWRYDMSAHKLYLPDGRIATYGSWSSERRRLSVIEDPYGNTLTPSWDGSTLLSVVQTVADAGNSGRTRTVEIDHDYDIPSLTTTVTLSYDSRNWVVTSGLSGVISIAAPAGPDWEFSYATDTVVVTTPQGGTATYTFDDGKIDDIAIAGRAVTSGTWGFVLNQGDTTTATVTTP